MIGKPLFDKLNLVIYSIRQAKLFPEFKGNRGKSYVEVKKELWGAVVHFTMQESRAQFSHSL